MGFSNLMHKVENVNNSKLHRIYKTDSYILNTFNAIIIGILSLLFFYKDFVNNNHSFNCLIFFNLPLDNYLSFHCIFSLVFVKINN